MPDSPFLFQPAGYLKRVAGRKLFILFCIECMHQIIIKIGYASGLQLTLKQGKNFRLCLKEGTAELIGEQKSIARITLCQALTHGGLTLSGYVSVCGIKITKSAVQKRVYHVTDLLGIHNAFPTDGAFCHWKPHASKTQFFGSKVQRFHCFSSHSCDIRLPFLLCYRGFPPLSSAGDSGESTEL